MLSIDKSQEAVINSQENRLFVEAPAGYGKTTVMVEKLVSDLMSGKIPHPKRALALTFSVNAARKMKNDIHDVLSKNNRQIGHFENHIDVFNYHALSREIILKHGIVYLGLSIDVNTLAPMNENHVLSYFQGKELPLSASDNMVLTSFSKAVRQANNAAIEASIDDYRDLICNVLIPNGCITYNAILVLAIKLLEENQSVCNLYRSLYPYLIVDEAQDTNLLSYKLLSNLIGERTRICMFGDSLQRIYGFIGAIPNFVEIAKSDFGLKILRLDTNHRFLPGSSMQLLDKNIRENIRNPLAPSIDSTSKVPLLFSGSAKTEVAHTCFLSNAILEKQADAKIAVLVRARGYYSNDLIEEMKARGIICFDGLFNDEEPEYVQFNDDCLEIFDRLTERTREINFPQLDLFTKKAKECVEAKSYIYGGSYLQLLEALNAQVKAEFAGVSPDAKYQYIRSVFENKSLRHVIDYIDANVVVTTMHASKGLEWDYVLLPELMQWASPAYVTCKNCCMELRGNEVYRGACSFKGKRVPESYIDELCLFYVAVTRAKRSAVFLATTDRINKSGEHKAGYLSCFMSMPGIESFKPSSIEEIILN